MVPTCLENFLLHCTCISLNKNYCIDTLDEAEMRDLIQELEEVTEWDYLGVCLGVPGSTLRAIRRDERGAEGRKRAMLIEWAKIKKPTWYRVVRALLEMGREVLAKRIAEKYGKN